MQYLRRATIVEPSLLFYPLALRPSALLARNFWCRFDDSLMRTLTDTRYCIECFTDVGSPFSKSMRAVSVRRRKFSNPLFLTPSGLEQVYPEVDGHLFADLAMAERTLKSAAQVGDWEIRRTSLAAELKSKRYLRWLAEVKGREYSEARRSLAELADIFEAGGVPSLQKLYTRTHARHIIRRLQAELPARFGKMKDQNGE